MRPKLTWLFAGLVLAFVFALPIQAVDCTGTACDLQPGLVLMTTSTLEPTVWSGSFLKGVFDGANSDEILDAHITLRAKPLETISGNPSVFWPADTLLWLKQGVDFTPGHPEPKTVRTRVMAVSLVGALPITVTYGGINPELWDVRVCQSHVPIDNTDGFLTLTNDCETAGTFVHTMLVFPKFIFTRQRDGRTITLDQGAGAGPVIVIARGFWTRREYATGSFASAPAGAKVDADCDGSYQNDVTLEATSNVLLGLARVNCNAVAPTHGYQTVQPTVYEKKDTFVLEPATQDDRTLSVQHSALPRATNPLAAKGLGALVLFGLAAVLIRPGSQP